jgi:hypothetical protein
MVGHLFLTYNTKSNMKNFNIDQDKGRIEFIDTRFYATPNGGYVPSVTTILEAYPKDASYFKWLKEVGGDADAIRDEAGRRGSLVHELTERYDSGEEVSYVDEYGRPKYKMLEWSMFERYVDFSVTHQPNIDVIEAHMVSSELGYAGTLDRIMRIDGKSYLVDIKTSGSIYPSYWLQLAAYRRLLDHGGLLVDEVAILWLNAKTRTRGKKGDIQGIGWQFVSKDNTDQEMRLFNATYELWKSMNEDIKPKQFSYQIKHKK